MTTTDNWIGYQVRTRFPEYQEPRQSEDKGTYTTGRILGIWDASPECYVVTLDVPPDPEIGVKRGYWHHSRCEIKIGETWTPYARLGGAK